MFLYCDIITPRIQYIAAWLGNYLFNKPLVLINDYNQLPAGSFVINYSNDQIPFSAYHIVPEGLLFEQTVSEKHISLTNTEKFPVLFAGHNGHPFDILSAIFYLLSRYEEYLPHQKDEYGRYAHKNSLAFQNGFLNRPLVDEWVQDLKEKLTQAFPGLSFIKRTFSYIPTYDVDLAWSYLNKGVARSAAGLLKQIIKGEWVPAKERLNALRSIKDPFDVFEDLELLHEKFDLQPAYFFLLAAKNRGYDKNISPFNRNYQQLITHIASQYKSGIHLSWQAYRNPQLMRQEKQLLEDCVGSEVTANRMHYIKFDLPQTYEKLESLGISEDYSMGYGSINGFRASTCTPYVWYNLALEKTSSLTLFPFAYMEANSIFEQKDDPETALKELQHYSDIIKKVNGMFITIFHNHLIGRSADGRKWWYVYEQFLQHNF